MNELFDKLIIRIFLAFFIIALLFLYRSIHAFIYPTTRKQLFTNFLPSSNLPETLHLFGRIIGIAIIFSNLNFYMNNGVIWAILDFTLQGSMSFILFLASIYILESISLFKFEFSDEVIKRKNLSYTFISFAQCIVVALIIKTLISISHHSFILLIFLWMFSMVMMGFAIKAHQFLSVIPFNALIIQKDLTPVYSFSGYMLGAAIVINSAMNQPIVNIQAYATQSLLQILLAIIIFPLLRKGLIKIYRIKLKVSTKGKDSKSDKTDISGPDPGYGIFEGVTFIATALLTSVIIGNIQFGNFYPVF